MYNKSLFFRLEQSLDLGGFSSDDDSLNYEDNADLESTIDKLRQLLLDKSGETESMSSEEAVQSPTSIKSSFYHNFRVTKESLEESPSGKSDFSPNLEESHQEVLVISFDTNDSEKNVRLIGWDLVRKLLFLVSSSFLVILKIHPSILQIFIAGGKNQSEKNSNWMQRISIQIGSCSNPCKYT